jgi:DNA-binding winged helix-turn-helix (wHTH) protein/tetratricopeptide (TPR) repeat protein
MSDSKRTAGVSQSGRDDRHTGGVARIDLANLGPFIVGRLEVHPALRQVNDGHKSEVLEPRVMQVLVVLAGSAGRVVPVEELIARCWNGRVVGDNAIHRVISKLHRLAEGLGGNSFAVENIPKVGYRLVSRDVRSPSEAREPSETSEPSEPSAQTTPTPSIPVVGRRVLIAVALAAVAGVATPLVSYQLRPRRRPSAEARELYRRGTEAQRQYLQEQNVQAVAYFREAVTLAPDYADAWGALAMAYRHLVETDPGRDQERLAALSRAAASSALELDPSNADAELALLTLQPYFRNWLEMERGLRQALPRHPDHWLYRGNIARILSETGRWRESIPELQAVIAGDPFLPFPRFRLALSYWSIGRLQQAETAIDEAARRWPSHPAVWFMRFEFLAFGGQPEGALAQLDRVEERPAGLPEAVFDHSRVLATAMATRAPSDTQAAVDAALRAVSRNIASVPDAVRALSALGETSHAFPLLDSYFLERPSPHVPEPPPLGPLTRRSTDFLFMPFTAALRADERFDRLTAEIGLVDYWAQTGAVPDYKSRG